MTPKKNLMTPKAIGSKCKITESQKPQNLINTSDLKFRTQIPTKSLEISSQ